MTSEVWQDDPPFAVGETQTAPATDEALCALEHRLASARRVSGCMALMITPDEATALIARIKAEREWVRKQAEDIMTLGRLVGETREQTIRELRDNYKCGEEYEAGLWSRRNIEAFFRDQEKET